MNTVLHINGQAVTLESVERKGQEIAFALNGKTYRFTGKRLQNGFVIEEEEAPGLWRRYAGQAWPTGKGAWQIALGDVEAKISETRASASSDASGTGALSPNAPVPGLVRQVLVKPGQKVKHGQALLVLEAMKLQMTISAGGDGTVEKILVSAGEMVAEGAELVRIKAQKK